MTSMVSTVIVLVTLLLPFGAMPSWSSELPSPQSVETTQLTGMLASNSSKLSASNFSAPSPCQGDECQDFLRNFPALDLSPRKSPIIRNHCLTLHENHFMSVETLLHLDENFQWISKMYYICKNVHSSHGFNPIWLALAYELSNHTLERIEEELPRVLLSVLVTIGFIGCIQNFQPVFQIFFSQQTAFIIINIFLVPFLEELIKRGNVFMGFLLPCFEMLLYLAHANNNLQSMYLYRIPLLISHLSLNRLGFWVAVVLHCASNGISYSGIDVFMNPIQWFLWSYFVYVCIRRMVGYYLYYYTTIQRQARDAFAPIYFFDTVHFKTRQSGIKVYWVVRHFADGHKIKFREAESPEGAYANRHSVEYQAHENLIDFVNTECHKPSWIISDDLWACFNICITFFGFWRIKAPKECYYLVLGTRIIEILGKRLDVSVMKAIIDKITTYLEVSSDRTFYSYEPMPTDPVFLNSERSTRPLAHDDAISRLNVFLNKKVELQVRELPKEKDKASPARAVAAFVSAAACAYGLLTLPSYTNSTVINRHLQSSMSGSGVDSTISVLFILENFVSNCHSLCVNIYYAAVTGRISSLFFGNKMLEEDIADIIFASENFSCMTVKGNVDLKLDNIYVFKATLDRVMHELSKVGCMREDKRIAYLTRLKSIKIDFEHNIQRASFRKQPFCCCIYGRSNIGKSTVMQMLFKIAADAYNLPSGEDMMHNVYVHSPKAKYFDGCQTYQWGYLFDDAASENPRLITGEQTGMDILIRVVNNTPFLPNMAHLEEKGKVVCQPRIVVLTTNNKDLNASASNFCPSAVLRRVKYYVTPTPRACVRAQDGSIDPAKANEFRENGGHLGEEWTYTVERVEIQQSPDGQVNRDQAIRVAVNFRGTPLVDASFDDFSQWYHSELLIHDRDQTRVVERMMSLTKELPWCKEHNVYHCSTCIDAAIAVANREQINETMSSLSTPPESNRWDKFNFSKWFGNRIRREALTFNWFYRLIPVTWWNVISMCLFKFQFGAHYSWNLALFDHVDQVGAFNHLAQFNWHRAREHLRRERFLKLSNEYYSCHISSVIQQSLKFSNGVTLGSFEEVLELPFPFPDNVKMRILDYVDVGTLISVGIMFLGFLILMLFSAHSFFLGIYFSWCVYRIANFSNSLNNLLTRVSWLQFLANHKRKIFVAIALLATLLVTIKLISSSASLVERQGISNSVPLDEKPKDWWDNKGNSDYFTMGRVSHNSQAAPGGSLNHAQVRQRIRSNIVSIDVYNHDGGLVRTAYGLALTPNHILTNLHTIRGDADIVRVTRHLSDYVRPDRLVATIKLDDWSVLRPTSTTADYVILRSENSMGVKDISAFLVPQGFNGVTQSALLSRSEERTLALRKEEAIITDVGCTFTKGADTYFMADRPIGTKLGDCGLPYVSMEGPLVILGIHGGVQLDRGGTPFCVSVSAEEFQDLLKRGTTLALPLKQQAFTHREALDFHSHELSNVDVRDCRDVTKRDCAAWIKPSVADVGCTIRFFRPNRKSDIVPSPAYAFWQECGRAVVKHIPDVKGWHRDSYGLCCKEINSMPEGLPMAKLEHCAKHYFDSCLTRLSAKDVNWKIYLQKFSLEESVKGVECMAYVDHVNYNTSAGFPWYKAKNLLGIMHDNPVPDWLVKRVARLEDVYKGGQRAHPIFCTHLKDEAVSERKALKKQLRVFVGSPVDFTLLLRKYLLGFVKLMQTHRLCFESAVAIRAQSTDWSDLYDYMNPEGFDKHIDGDYAAYDKGMSQGITSLACGIIVKFMREGGFMSESEISVIELMLNDVIDPLVEFDGGITFLHGTNPSGHPLTVLVNCIANSIYARYCFLDKYGSLEKFLEWVRLVTYGDDNHINNHPESTFTHQDMVVSLKKIGITYTDSEKSSDVITWKDSSKVSFLKRAYRHDQLLSSLYGRRIMRAPLEEGSINKMLCYTKKGDNPVMVLANSMRSALTEGVLLGEDYYEKLRVDCIRCFRRYLGDFDFKIKTYREQLAVFYERLDSYQDTGGVSEGSSTITTATLWQAFSPNAVSSSLSLGDDPNRLANFLQFDNNTTDEREYLPNTDISDSHTGDMIGPISSVFERDIKIATISMTEGSTTHYTLYPWTDYLTNGFIADKLKNFSKLRGNLHLTLIVNANPFLFGSVLVSYKPMSYKDSDYPGDPMHVAQSEVRDISGGVIDDNEIANAGTSILAKSQLMQRPHVMIYPQETTKVEMDLPFWHFNDYIQLFEPVSVSQQPLNAMGKLLLVPILPLSSCTTPSLNPINIDIFARMSDVDICGPSIQRQADEYDADKPVSSTASAIAAAAGHLSSIPVIGWYATATSVVAKGIADVARWFGFSNPVNLANVNPVKTIYATRWADTENVYPLPKLALDGKNELSIDGRILGMDGEDSMVIENICRVPQLMGVTEWACTDAVDIDVQTGLATPGHFHSSPFVLGPTELAIGGSHTVFALAPATWIAQSFEHWCGDMVVHFKVLCSKFHRGRLRFVFDPAGKFNNFTEGKIFSKIIDISNENEVSIRIPWQSYRPKLNTFAITHGATTDLIFAERGNVSSDPEIFSSISFGFWRLQVMTALSAPLDTSAYVQTCVSFENMGFSKPRQPLNARFGGLCNYSPPITIQRQSHEVVPGKGVSNKVSLMVDGETCMSLRQLLHRWTYAFERYSAKFDSCSANSIWRLRIPRFPYYNGTGFSLSNDQVGPLSITKFERGGLTPLNYFTPAFCFRRGGIHWRINPSIISSTNAGLGVTACQGQEIDDCTIAMDTSDRRFGLDHENNLTLASYNSINTALLASGNLTEAGWQGMELVKADKQQCEACCPDYFTGKGRGCNQFLVNRYNYPGPAGGFPLADTGELGDNLAIHVFTNRPATRVGYTSFDAMDDSVANIRGYVCAGVDYSLHGFLNVPSIYLTAFL